MQKELKDFPKVNRRTAIPANDSDLKNDAHGFTNPNLHRRVDAKQPSKGSEEVLPRDYNFSVAGWYSYRNTHNFIQDEDSDISEVP